MGYTDHFDMLSTVGNAITGMREKFSDAGNTFSNSPGNFIIATAAETVGTIWNSLTPAPINVDTTEFLRTVDRDAAKMLEANRESINLASMFAGSIAPAGLAVKAMNLARSGTFALGYSERAIGSSWVGSKQRALTKEIDDIFNRAGPDTTQYAALRRRLFASNATKEILDNFVIEAAVVGAMNAHPWMEDYKENPLQNYLLGAALGGVFGVGFAWTATKSAIRGVTASTEQAFHSKLLESGLEFVHPGFTNSGQIQARNRNVEILDRFVNDTTQSQYFRDMAASVRFEEREAAAQALKDAAPWLDKEPADSPLRAFVTDILNDPNFIGVDQVLRFNMDKLSDYTPRQAALVKDPNVMPAGKTHWMHESLVDDKAKAETIFVRLGTKDVFAFEGARNAALAADIPNIKTLIAEAAQRKDIALTSPIRDWGEDNLFRGRSSAQMDADFLKRMVGYKNVTANQLPNLQIDPGDLPTQNAFIAYVGKLDPADQANIKVKLSGEFPTFTAQKEFVEKTVKPSYWSDVQRTSNANDTFDVLSRNGDSRARDAERLLHEWLGSKGERVDLVRAMNQHFTGTRTASSSADAQAATLIWESGAKFRQAMRANADADGYVYLWRGSTAKEFTHSSVQSYSFDRTASTSFAGGAAPNPKLYKVHVDNLIGSLSKGGLRSEYEIIATAPHYETANNVPISTGANTAVRFPEAGKVTSVDVTGLIKHYADATTAHIKQLDSTGLFSAEEISARTNVTHDGVMFVLGGGHLKDAQAEWRRYKDIDKVNEYMGETNKLIAFRGNPSRNQMANQYSSLDRHQYRAMQQQEVESFTHSSHSKIGNTLFDVLNPMKLQTDLFNQTLSQVGHALVDKPRWQSADQMIRHLENGSVVTGVGKLLVNKIDQLRKEILEPLVQPSIGIRSRPTQIVEFNAVVNKLYSMRGWRDIVEDPITGKWVIVGKDAAGNVRFETKANGDMWIIQQNEVAHLLNATRAPSQELKLLHNLNRKLRGHAPLNDLGFYLPPLNLVDRNYAFVIDRSGQKGTQLLIGDTAADLESQIKGWQGANTTSESMTILRKGDQEADALARHYSIGDMYVTYANVSAQHTGVASLANLPTDTRLLENILKGYETSVIQSSRSYVSHYLGDTVSWLDHLSYFYNRNVRDQPKQGLKKETINNPAESIRNVLLGQDQLREDVMFKGANNYTEFLINGGLRTIDGFLRNNTLDVTTHRDYFDNLNKELKKLGINDNPLGTFQEYLAASHRETKNLAPGLVSAASGLTATMGLRVWEFANAAVNTMSIPILTWSALMERLPATPIQNTTGSIVFPIRVMMDAIRHMYSPQGRALEAKMWHSNGLIDQNLRQFEDSVTVLNRAQLGKGASENAIAAMHAITNNKGIIRLLSTPSDWAEKFTRRFAMHTGYVAAKTAYPSIDDMGATIAAMHFADRTVGNYHAAQRPTMFQGTLGATIGLYQTYMLTYAQHVYRGLENRNFKQLAGTMLLQAGIFGTKSLPGYNLLSEHVVSHFNNEQWDLTTGTYRAIGDPLAEMVLYGMPSSITGAAFYTRGDVTPRVPSSMGDIAILNAAIQGYKFTTDLVGKVAQGAKDGAITRNMLEAISLQSLNRPAARWSEIITGTSQTSQGNTVATQDEVWTPMGIAARTLGARPLQEQVTREAIHLNKFYEQRDFENRQKAMASVKLSLRSGELDDAVLSRVAMDYLKNGGTSKGWRSIMNDTLVHADLGARMDLKRKLEPVSPLHTMIGDFF